MDGITISPIFCPHFLIHKRKTHAHWHLQGAGLRAWTQRLGKKKAGVALLIAAIPWIWQGRNCRLRANISQNIYNADSDHGREWEWSGVWVELTHKWKFIKVQQAENPLLISQLFLLISFFRVLIFYCHSTSPVFRVWASSGWNNLLICKDLSPTSKLRFIWKENKDRMLLDCQPGS